MGALWYLSPQTFLKSLRKLISEDLTVSLAQWTQTVSPQQRERERERETERERESELSLEFPYWDNLKWIVESSLLEIKG